MILNDAEQKEQVRAFILEMTAAQFVRRSVGQMAGLSYDMIFPTKHKPYRLTTYQREEFGDKARHYASLPITVYDDCFEVHQIVNRIRRDAMRDGVRRFYIDYAQRINVRGAKTPLEAQSYASKLISQTAQELNVSIVVLAQVGRAATKNPHGRPEAVDIADCDNWARDCGQLAFLHRPPIDDFHPRNEFGVPLGRDGQPLRVTPAEFLVRLNRFGLGEADVKLGFYGERGAFVSPVLE
jgi:replicative DNA helicase